MGFQLVDTNCQALRPKPFCREPQSKRAEVALDAIGLTVNANSIPDDTLPPFRPSGIRLGTPALTTRGLKEQDMPLLAEWMAQAIAQREDGAALDVLHQQVEDYLKKY